MAAIAERSEGDITRLVRGQAQIGRQYLPGDLGHRKAAADRFTRYNTSKIIGQGDGRPFHTRMLASAPGVDEFPQGHRQLPNGNSPIRNNNLPGRPSRPPFPFVDT